MHLFSNIYANFYQVIKQHKRIYYNIAPEPRKQARNSRTKPDQYTRPTTKQNP